MPARAGEGYIAQPGGRVKKWISLRKYLQIREPVTIRSAESSARA